MRQPAAHRELAGHRIEAAAGRTRRGPIRRRTRVWCRRSPRSRRSALASRMPVVSMTDGRCAAQRPIGLRLDGAGAHVGVEAADAAARTRPPFGLDDEVTELADVARAPVEQPTRRHHSPVDRVADEHAGEVAQAGRRARTTPRPRRTRARRCRSPPATPATSSSCASQREALPLREQCRRRPSDDAIDRAGTGDAAAGRPRAFRGGGDHPAHQACERRPDMPRRRRDPVAHDQLAGVVDDAGRETGDAEVDREVGGEVR